MRTLTVLGLAAAIAACGNLSAKGADKPGSIADGEEFPVAGTYHVVHEYAEREEADSYVDASDRAKFEQLIVGDSGSRCRDREVKIKDGSFSFRMTCDAPDGDIHNIGISGSGSYSKNSIDITQEYNLWGSPMRETRTFRLKQS